MTEALRIVIAEDDEGHATLVQRQLQRAGVRSPTIRLHDGQELIDYLAAPGVYRAYGSLALLVDLHMPRLDGVEVLRRLKSDRALARIPVFVLTTSDNPADIDRCYTFGAAACLIKPIDRVQFAAVVQRLADFLMVMRLPSDAPLPRNANG